MNTCKKKKQDDDYFNLIYKIVVQFIKSLLIIGSIFILIYIRKNINENLNIGKIISYIMLASLVLVIIYMTDNFVYNNLIIGLGIYFGFELLKF